MREIRRKIWKRKTGEKSPQSIGKQPASPRPPVIVPARSQGHYACTDTHANAYQRVVPTCPAILSSVAMLTCPIDHFATNCLSLSSARILTDGHHVGSIQGLFYGYLKRFPFHFSLFPFLSSIFPRNFREKKKARKEINEKEFSKTIKSLFFPFRKTNQIMVTIRDYFGIFSYISKWAFLER